MNKTDKMVADALAGSWVHRYLPQSLWPYAQLARWERPIGWWLLMWPCWWSLMLGMLNRAAGRQLPTENVAGRIPDGSVLIIIAMTAATLLAFMAGAILMRGAGCTYNDLTDQDIDRKVARTRSRPLPSGRVSRRQATLFLALQLAGGFLILLTFNRFTIWLGIASLATVAIYPFMKRITWWPQLFLGLAFSWGALMGWAAVYASFSPAPIVLYIGCVFWVIGYDTIYAHQDREDDALVGVKSTARLFGERTKPALGLLYGGAFTLILIAYWLVMPVTDWRYWPAYGALALGGMQMIRQIRVLNIDDGDRCLALFKSNSRLGWVVFAGLAVAVALNLRTLAYGID